MVESLSKTYAMTGWRIGFVAAPAEIVDRMTKCQENFNACANAPGQYAATVALDHPELCEELRQIFERRRSILLDGLAKIDGIPAQRVGVGDTVSIDLSNHFTATNVLGYTVSVPDLVKIELRGGVMKLTGLKKGRTTIIVSDGAAIRKPIEVTVE